MTDFIELDLADIAAIGKEEPKKRRGGGPRNKLDTSIRNHDTWFHLQMTLGFCENPNCIDQRPKKVAEGNAMVAVVNGKSMCRPCFLIGYNK